MALYRRPGDAVRDRLAIRARCIFVPRIIESGAIDVLRMFRQLLAKRRSKICVAGIGHRDPLVLPRRGVLVRLSEVLRFVVCAVIAQRGETFLKVVAERRHAEKI